MKNTLPKSLTRGTKVLTLQDIHLWTLEFSKKFRRHGNHVNNTGKSFLIATFPRIYKHIFIKKLYVQILPVCFDDSMAFQSSPLQNEKMSCQALGNNSRFFSLCGIQIKGLKLNNVQQFNIFAITQINIDDFSKFQGHEKIVWKVCFAL